MSLLRKLFGKTSNGRKEETEINGEPEHAVIVYFDYGIEGLEPIFELGNKLKKIISDSNVREYDGHEIAMDYSDGSLYMYGPNAEVLFKTIKSTLEATEFLKGAKAKLRFGPPEDGVKEIEVEIE
ncbi:MAG: hypothetical protein AAGF85_01485 [Bacteroidota bacterium]